MTAGLDGTHDLEIVNGSTTINLMLDRDEKGLLKYQEFPLKGAAERFTTGVPSLTDLPPEWSIKVAMESWHEGLGDFQFVRPNKGGDSTGADTGYDGLILPGPSFTVTDVSASTTEGLTNGGFELGTAANWTASGTGSPTITATTTNTRTGTYAGDWETNNADNQLTQTVSFTGRNNKAVVFTVWVRTSTSAYVGDCRPFITDTDGTVYGNTVTISATYQKMVVSKVITQASGTFTVGLDILAEVTLNGITLDDATCVFTHDSTLGKFVDHEASTYVSIGGVVYRWTSGAWTPRWVSAVGVTDLISFGTYMLVSRGASDEFAYVDDATTRTTYTIMTASGNLTKGNFFNALGLDSSSPPVPEVYKLRNPNDLDKSTNPTNSAAWTNVADVGSDKVNFTGAGVGQFGGANQHFMGKEDGLWRGTTAPNTLLPRPAGGGPDNFRVIHTANWGWTYMITDGGGLLAYEPVDGALADISPAYWGPNFATFTGPVVALTSDDFWLYAVVDGGGTSYVFKGHQPLGRSFSWHLVGALTFDTPRAAFVSSADGTLRLFIAGTHSSAPTIASCILSTRYNPLDDTAYVYKTGVTYITPWITGGFPGTNKSLSGVHLEAAGISATEYLGLEYQKWGDAAASWTVIDATLDTTDFSGGVAEKFLGTFVNSTAFRFRFTWTQTTGTAVPAQLKRFVVFMGLVQPMERYVKATALMRNGTPTYQGGIDPEPAKDKLDALRTAKSSAMLTITDPIGTAWKGRLIDYTAQILRDPRTADEVVLVDLVLKEDRTS